MEGCDGSRIDFVTKILNKNGIQRPTHLIKNDYELKLENTEELFNDEVNKIKAFITESWQFLGVVNVCNITIVINSLKYFRDLIDMLKKAFEMSFC